MIRKATVNDAQAIKTLKDTIWPSDATDEKHITSIISNPNQTIFIDEINAEITGLAAGFMTHFQDNTPRWEIDLLAVHTDHQRKGIAKNLVNALTEVGREQGAKTARALIQTQNIGSQRTFSACGYVTDGDIRALYVSDAESANNVESIDGCHLIPVSTLNYNGVWIEGEFKPESFILGQAMRTQHQWDIAGAIIPIANEQAITDAEANGFVFINHFQAWICNLR
jgi:N-acetylglutamate synthase-like GNAT family acetyltransferase